MFFEVFIL